MVPVVPVFLSDLAVPVPVPSGLVVPSVLCVALADFVFLVFAVFVFDVLELVDCCMSVVPFWSCVMVDLSFWSVVVVVDCVFLSVCADTVPKENSKTANKMSFFII